MATTHVASGELESLAANCDDAAGVLDNAQVSAHSDAAATAMPGGSSPGALQSACAQIDTTIANLQQAINDTAAAARETQAAMTQTDGASAQPLNHAGGAIANHGYNGYGG